MWDEVNHHDAQKMLRLLLVIRKMDMVSETTLEILIKSSGAGWLALRSEYLAHLWWVDFKKIDQLFNKRSKP
jgi:hypothetical protein